MTIANKGQAGTGAHSTSSSSYTFNTATTQIDSGEFAILVSVFDNSSSTDGDNNENTSVSGGTGTWTKLGEWGNSNGSAGSGVVVAMWLFEATGTNATGTTITVNFSGNRNNKTCSFRAFTKATGTTIVLDPEPGTNPITNDTDASNDYGSVAFSGLTSVSRLSFRGLGKEVNSTTQLTVSTGFTAIAVQRSQAAAGAVIVRGEYRVNASTGETSNPTLAVVGDTAGLFCALKEQMAGSAAVTLGAMTASGAATVDVAGAASVTLGALTASAAGTVAVSGAAAITLGAMTLSAASGRRRRRFRPYPGANGGRGRWVIIYRP